MHYYMSQKVSHVLRTVTRPTSFPAFAKRRLQAYASQVLAIFVLVMAVQKSNQPAAMSDNDISGSGSDDSESGEICTGPNNHVAKEPEISG